MCDLGQSYSMAKQGALFAGSQRYGFFIANGPHLKTSGGLLHR
jgi:hypothetical protein